MADFERELSELRRQLERMGRDAAKQSHQLQEAEMSFKKSSYEA